MPAGGVPYAGAGGATLARAPAAVSDAPPPPCPCGHPISDDYRCIAGWVYGPCGHEACGGVCETFGQCTGKCTCDPDD